MITLERLQNGLPVVFVSSTNAVGWAGVAIDAGSRDEARGEYGLAHFVEHTIFKGTRLKRAWQINSRMERVGGELNAYTTKETTMLYSVFPQSHLDRALELIGDLVTGSVFPALELDRERQVVLEEAASYLDSPADAIYDDFENLLFAGSGLGHNILGTEDDVRGFTTADCRRFVDRQYGSGAMSLFVVGNYRPEQVLRLAEKHFASLSTAAHRRRQPVPPVTAAERVTRQLGLHQAHTLVGARVGSMYDDGRHALALLNNIIGGPGMNSLLNVELRERRGYVYSVESSLTSYTDCGALLIYFGCDVDRVERVLAVVGRVIDRLASERLSERRLDALKRQYCGQLLVASDNTELTALNAGRCLLYYGKVEPMESTIERLRAVTADELRDLAAAIALPRATVLTFH